MDASHDCPRLYIPAEEMAWRFRTWIENYGKDGVVLLAEEDGRAVGFIQAHLRHANTSEVEQMDVRTGFQQKGIGTVLFREAAAQLGRAGAESVFVRVWVASAANEFYGDRLGGDRGVDYPAPCCGAWNQQTTYEWEDIECVVRA